jgi:hypothetical protein
MYRKIATAIVTTLVLATGASAAISKPTSGISPAEQAWFDRASNPRGGGN